MKQVSVKTLTKEAVVKDAGEAAPAGFTRLDHEFEHEGDDHLNHVLYHHVKDALYLAGITDIAKYSIKLA